MRFECIFLSGVLAFEQIASNMRFELILSPLVPAEQISFDDGSHTHEDPLVTEPHSQAPISTSGAATGVPSPPLFVWMDNNTAEVTNHIVQQNYGTRRKYMAATTSSQSVS
jgi:hypothetical protein